MNPTHAPRRTGTQKERISKTKSENRARMIDIDDRTTMMECINTLRQLTRYRPSNTQHCTLHRPSCMQSRGSGDDIDSYQRLEFSVRLHQIRAHHHQRARRDWRYFDLLIYFILFIKQLYHLMYYQLVNEYVNLYFVINTMILIMIML